MEQDRQDAYLDALLEANQVQSGFIDQLAETVGTLADRVERTPTKSFMYKVGGAIAALVVALVLILNVASYQSSHDALEEIRSCTTPTGECAERGAESQANAIGQIVCNQEKILYIAYGDVGYTPLPFCNHLVNTEIERLQADGSLVEGIELLPEEGYQVSAIKESVVE